jgi:methionyl-tRNA formyltransferase
MKIGFFGTPELAKTVIAELYGKFQISFAVTMPDKPQGRSKKLIPTPVKEFAEEHKIPLFQPITLKDYQFITSIQEYEADIFVVFAYGRIIPRSVFDMPRLKTINMHPSLLPKYRGAAPIPWAVINGETVTGVTIQLIDEELDSGDIVLQKNFEISSNDTTDDLNKTAINIGASLLKEAVIGLNDGSLTPIKQDHDKATYCGKITRDTSQIDWLKSAAEIHNLIRGLNPKPIAWTTFRENELKIYKSKVFDETIGQNLKPGELYKLGKKRLLIGTGNGLLEILNLQPSTKKIMDAPSFLNGARLTEGETCG